MVNSSCCVLVMVMLQILKFSPLLHQHNFLPFTSSSIPGFDTTTGTLGFTLAVLLKHPDILARYSYISYRALFTCALTPASKHRLGTVVEVSQKTRHWVCKWGLYVHAKFVTTTCRAQEEVSEVLEDRTDITAEDLERLQYIEQVPRGKLSLKSQTGHIKCTQPMATIVTIIIHTL